MTVVVVVVDVVFVDVVFVVVIVVVVAFSIVVMVVVGGCGCGLLQICSIFKPYPSSTGEAPPSYQQQPRDDFIPRKFWFQQRSY